MTISFSDSGSWRKLTICALVMVMDACWLTPLVAIVSGLVGLQPVPTTVILTLYLSTFLSGHLVHRLRLDTVRSRVLVIYLAAVTILVVLKLAHYGDYPWLSLDWLARLAYDLSRMSQTVPPPILTILLAVLLWWGGLRLSRQQITQRLVVFHFQAGMGLFVFVLVLAAMRPLPDPSGPIFIYFFSALLAMAVARMEAMTDGRRSSLDRYWLTVLLATIAVVLVASAAVFSSISTTQSIVEFILGILQVVARFVADVLFLILTPLGYLAEWLIRLLEPLRQGAQQVAIAVPKGSPVAPKVLPQAVELPAVVKQVLNVAPWIALLILVAWLLGKALGHQRDYANDDMEEERESAGTFSDFWSDVASFFRGLWDRLRGTARLGVAAVAEILHREESDATLSVRQVYARLLRLAASLGAPRRPEQTPYEYLSDLECALPEATADVTTITEAYVQARYSPAPPSQDHVTTVRAAWTRLRKGLLSER